MTPRITDAGKSLLLRALDGTGLTFTKMAMGSGSAPEDYRSLTDLVSPAEGTEIGLDGITLADGYALLKGVLNNEDISESFDWTEIGIYCQDPDDADGDDILYAYGNVLLEEESAIPVAKYTGDNAVEIAICVYVYVGEAEDVTVILADSSVYAMKTELMSVAYDGETETLSVAYGT